MKPILYCLLLLLLLGKSRPVQAQVINTESTFDKIYKTSQVILALVKINADNKRMKKLNVTENIQDNSTNFCLINTGQNIVSISLRPKDTAVKMFSGELVAGPGIKECLFNVKAGIYMFTVMDTKTFAVISKGELKISEAETFEKTVNR